MLSQTTPAHDKSDDEDEEEQPPVKKSNGGDAQVPEHGVPAGVSLDAWFASLFNDEQESDERQSLFDAMRDILKPTESARVTETVLSANADAVERGGNRDSAIECAVRKLMAQEIRATQQLMRRAGQVSAKAKAAGEFTFGSQQDFVGGLQGLIGVPSGLNEKQWLEQMSREHCSVTDGWAISSRSWITGNYRLSTSPGREFTWVWQCKEDDGTCPPYIVGGLQEDGSEDVALRRQATRFDQLFSEV